MNNDLDGFHEIYLWRHCHECHQRKYRFPSNLKISPDLEMKGRPSLANHGCDHEGIFTFRPAPPIL